MLATLDPIWQALLGTLFTWGVTAAGASLVFCCKKAHRKLLDSALGFAAGVMIAASFWSLLVPSIDMAKDLGTYGTNGEWVFIPAAVGFVAGAAFVFGADAMLRVLGLTGSAESLMFSVALNKNKDNRDLGSTDSYDVSMMSQDLMIRRRTTNNTFSLPMSPSGDHEFQKNDVLSSRNSESMNNLQWRRILLLIVAITVHNIPEGLAVGVAFGAVSKSDKSSFAKARNLAIGIGLQNFPEGLAVSLPLRAAGLPARHAFWWGQLSGVVEPVAGLLGCACITLVKALLPYALAFAAGAMILVVVDDIIPESHSSDNGRLASIACIVGFLVMMCLDVGLGA